MLIARHKFLVQCTSMNALTRVTSFLLLFYIGDALLASISPKSIDCRQLLRILRQWRNENKVIEILKIANSSLIYNKT